MDELKKICNELQDCKTKKLCYSNEIYCAKTKLKHYFDKDYDKILKIKAQIKMYNSFNSEEMAMFSLVISALTLCVTILSHFFQNDSIIYGVYCCVAFIIVIVFCVIFEYGKKKFGNISKWIRYVEVAIEEIEKEYNK